MNWFDRLCSRRDISLNLRNIDIVCDRIDIDKNRRRPEPGDRTDGREKAVWGRNNLIAGADIESHQRKQDRITTGRAADRMFHAAICRKFAFEFGDFPAEDKAVGVEHTPKRGLNLRPQAFVLFF